MSEQAQATPAPATEQIHTPRPEEREMTSRAILAGYLLREGCLLHEHLNGPQDRLVVRRVADRRHSGLRAVYD